MWYLALGCGTVAQLGDLGDSVCNTVERHSLSYMAPPFSIPVFTEETWGFLRSRCNFYRMQPCIWKEICKKIKKFDSLNPVMVKMFIIF